MEDVFSIDKAVARYYYQEYAFEYLCDKKKDGIALVHMDNFADAFCELNPHEAVKYAYRGRNWRDDTVDGTDERFNPYADWYFIDGGYPVSVSDVQFADYYDSIIDAQDFVRWVSDCYSDAKSVQDFTEWLKEQGYMR